MHISDLRARPHSDYSPHVQQLLKDRYFCTDRNGQPRETIRALWERVASAVALGDANYGEDIGSSTLTFSKMLNSGAFLPNTPCIMNAGRPKGQLCGCFLLTIEDDADQQLDSIRKIGMIHKTGGGTGMSFSRMRPAGDIISSGGKAYGFLPFARAINMVTQAFKQSGRRRGANMGVMHISHPEIETFITCKQTAGELENFNISVMVDDHFMHCLKQSIPYPLINPRTKKAVRAIDAGILFRMIAEAAHKSAEPGLMFEDTINEAHTCAELGPIDCTNPCGEVPLPTPSICNLGSINLMKCLDNTGRELDWQLLRELTIEAVHFLDNVVDINHYPFSEFEEFGKTARTIGLGVMGWADLLIAMGIPYNSDRAISFADRVAKFFVAASKEGSRLLMESRGCNALKERECRNAMINVIAPTGTIALLAGEVSSGIEPVFAWKYQRIVHTDQGPTPTDFEHSAYATVIEEVDGSKNLPPEFVTTQDIDWEWHLRHQAVWQEFVDGSISKTINLPANCTVDTIEQAYKLAYTMKCKGITIYRDGSRTGQTLQANCPECEDETCSTGV